jgi:hypothetical protein
MPSKRKTLKLKIYELLITAELTGGEIAARLNLPTQTRPAPRLAELQEEGLIEDTGITRQNPLSDEPATVWRAVREKAIGSNGATKRIEARQLRRKLNEALRNMPIQDQIVFYRMALEQMIGALR